jgi:hypothetical protein
MVNGRKSGEKPVERTMKPGREATLQWMQEARCMPNPWVSLRHDQLIPVNKAVNKKNYWKRGLEEEEKLVSSTYTEAISTWALSLSEW